MVDAVGGVPLGHGGEEPAGVGVGVEVEGGAIGDGYSGTGCLAGRRGGDPALLLTILSVLILEDRVTVRASFTSKSKYFERNAKTHTHAPKIELKI